MTHRPLATMPTASEFMAHPVFTLKPEMPVMDALAALLHRGISGAPVVDAEGHLVGVLSEHDCLRVMAGAAFHATPEGKVREHMTHRVETIRPDTDLFEVAGIFQGGQHRRLPVLDQGRLIGIVARRDLLRALEKLRTTREAQAAVDMRERAGRRSALHE